MRVHLEGMGFNGAMLARLLTMRGFTVTWHDTDAPRSAWPACTGAVYPSGSTKFGPDEECRTVWARWYEEGRAFRRGVLEQANYAFVTKNPPHGGKYEVTDTGLGLRVAKWPSYHVNAQALVAEVRDELRQQRLSAPPQPHAFEWYVVTHGFGRRLDHAYWGWSQQVELDVQRVEALQRGGLRPAFYVRPNRFVLCYAYPVPGQPRLWYAGSSLIRQKPDRLNELTTEDKYRRWAQQLDEYAGAVVTVRSRPGQLLQGWRPAAADTDLAWVKKRGNVLTLRPLWNSGVRHFPKQWEGVAEHMGVTP